MDKKEQLIGLTQAQVDERLARKEVNQFNADASTSTWDIVKRNVFTLFNALNFAIAIALMLVQAWSNLVFFAVICFNAFSGIVTELRAKHMIDKLNLLNKEQVQVYRDGQLVAVDSEELVLDDVILLAAGEQVPSDAKVLSGMAETNEAMLTGESDLVPKNTNDELLSGSFLASGQVQAQIIRVGAENYAAKLMTEAKVVKPINSKILSELNKIANFTGKIIIPFGLILFFEAFVMKMLPLKDSVVNTSTALLGMLPKGIALLTITSLLTAVIKLGMRKVLVQEMYSVETLARVDTLCLDKTGTITEGKMTVEDLEVLSSDLSKEDILENLAHYMNHSEDKNPTARAIRHYITQPETKVMPIATIPFSSDRKWGAIQFENKGSFYLGATDFLVANTTEFIQAAQERGSRVLAFAWSPDPLNLEQPSLPDNLEALTILEISDPVREGAAETLEYLRSQNVDLKIISGDNPVTVSNVAAKAGFHNYDQYLDCSKVTDEELEAAVATTAIFGRVSPHQKRLIIQTLKAAGHTTAMTGDGVNDILALREADVSIVMAEGDPATRQIANLVLLNSDFNDVPEILFEGRRVVNNIGKIAPIFFIKTIYSFILSIICMATVLFFRADWIMIFPFIPIQITLVDQFVEGFPPFVLTFERNIKPVEPHFLKKSMFLALPNALMIIISVLFSQIYGSIAGWSSMEIGTLSYYLLGTISFLAVIRACLPLNLWRVGLILWSVGGFFLSAYFLKGLLHIGTLTANTWPVYLVLATIFTLIFILFSKRYYPKEMMATA